MSLTANGASEVLVREHLTSGHINSILDVIYYWVLGEVLLENW